MATIYRIFLKGLLTILPITITLYLLVWITASADAVFGDPLKEVLPENLYFPGIGILIALTFVFLVGLLVNHYLAARLVRYIEEQIQKVPLIKAIYSPLRDIMNLFANHDSKELKRVVLVEIPHLGVSLLGLVTREDFTDFPVGTIADGAVAVFIPYSYAVGGFTVVVPKGQVREVNISVDRAMQLAVTGWIKSEKIS